MKVNKKSNLFPYPILFLIKYNMTQQEIVIKYLNLMNSIYISSTEFILNFVIIGSRILQFKNSNNFAYKFVYA